MTADQFIKLTDILSDISKSLSRGLFWQDYSFWGMIVSVLTLVVLIIYTRATQQLVENQMMPAVDVNMVYEKDEDGDTYLWFSNASSIPAFISIKVTIGTNKIFNIPELLIPPNHPRFNPFKRTSNHYHFLNDENKILLKVIVRPALAGAKGKIEFRKSYDFNKNLSRWDEHSWQFPDPEFPSQN